MKLSLPKNCNRVKKRFIRKYLNKHKHKHKMVDKDAEDSRPDYVKVSADYTLSEMYKD